MGKQGINLREERVIFWPSPWLKFIYLGPFTKGPIICMRPFLSVWSSYIYIGPFTKYGTLSPPCGSHMESDHPRCMPAQTIMCRPQTSPDLGDSGVVCTGSVSHSEKLCNTRCSAITERPRCRVRYSFRQKLNTGTEWQYFVDVSLQPLWYNRPENLSNSIKKRTQNKGYYGVQGHSRSSRSVTIESLYVISY